MKIEIPVYYKAAQLLAAVDEAAPGADICCAIERQYAILKIALVRLQRDDLSLQLVDGGRVVKQVTARRLTAEERQEPHSLTAAQLAAIHELEKAFRRCRELKLRFVGFSDSLVAVPEQLGCGADVLSSPAALELDTYDAYHGFDDDLA